MPPYTGPLMEMTLFHPPSGLFLHIRKMQSLWKYVAQLKASLIYLAQPPTLWAATSNSCLYTCRRHVSQCFPKLYLKEDRVFVCIILIQLFSFYSLFLVVHFIAPRDWFTVWMCSVHLQKIFWKQVGRLHSFTYIITVLL